MQHLYCQRTKYGAFHWYFVKISVIPGVKNFFYFFSIGLQVNLNSVK